MTDPSGQVFPQGITREQHQTQIPKLSFIIAITEVTKRIILVNSTSVAALHSTSQHMYPVPLPSE